MSLWGWVVVGVLVALVGVSGFVGYALGRKAGRSHTAEKPDAEHDDDLPPKSARPATANKPKSAPPAAAKPKAGASPRPAPKR